jgi:hypothetical protein
MEDLTAECGETVDDIKLKEAVGNNVGNYLAWYTRNSDTNVPQGYRAVFIKLLTRGRLPVVFEARSEVGNNTQGEPLVKVGDPYGTVYECTENVEAVCLELKHSGLASMRPQQPLYVQDDTYIKVQIHKDSRGLCNGYSINPRLNEYVRHPTPDNVNDFKFELSLNEAFLYGQTIRLHIQGIYLYDADSSINDVDVVRDTALHACKAGIAPGPGIEDGPANRDNYALEFHCA